MQAWFIGRTPASQAGKGGSIPLACSIYYLPVYSRGLRDRSRKPADVERRAQVQILWRAPSSAYSKRALSSLFLHKKGRACLPVLLRFFRFCGDDFHFYVRGAPDMAEVVMDGAYVLLAVVLKYSLPDHCVLDELDGEGNIVPVPF